MTNNESSAETPRPADAIAINVPLRPDLETRGIALLEMHMRLSRSYLEYGAGGSTVLAADTGVAEIHSVDSNIDLLSAAVARVQSRKPAAIVHTYHVDVGPTKEWGKPSDPRSANRWPNYSIAPWSDFVKNGKSPDLILIDGRFRVACFLASLIFSKAGTVILFDDYVERPHYTRVEKHVMPAKIVGRLAKFIVPEYPDKSALMLDLMKHSTNPN